MKPIRMHNRQEGVMLLEVLLGILLFSIGILAVVGMQALAVRSVAESKYRMDASFLANEVIGQMWTNRANLSSYAYSGGTPPSVVSNWVTRVGGTLPGTAANPPTIDVTGSVVTVTIFWQHPEEANLSPAPPPHSYTAIATLTCC